MPLKFSAASKPWDFIVPIVPIVSKGAGISTFINSPRQAGEHLRFGELHRVNGRPAAYLLSRQNIKKLSDTALQYQ